MVVGVPLTLNWWNSTMVFHVEVIVSSTEQLRLGNPWNWNTLVSPYYVWVNVTNVGRNWETISSVRIDNQPANMTVVWTSVIPLWSPITIPRGEKACIQISRTTPFTAGTEYNFTIFLHGNNKPFAVTGVAPPPPH
jgi:hypothetical protein